MLSKSATEFKQALRPTGTQTLISINKTLVKSSHFGDFDHRFIQGQTHPHRAPEESFITPLEEIQRWQRNCDRISPLKCRNNECCSHQENPHINVNGDCHWGGGTHQFTCLEISSKF